MSVASVQKENQQAPVRILVSGHVATDHTIVLCHTSEFNISFYISDWTNGFPFPRLFTSSIGGKTQSGFFLLKHQSISGRNYVRHCPFCFGELSSPKLISTEMFRGFAFRLFLTTLIRKVMSQKRPVAEMSGWHNVTFMKYPVHEAAVDDGHYVMTCRLITRIFFPRVNS